MPRPPLPDEAIKELAILRATEETSCRGDRTRAEQLVHAATVEVPPSPLGKFLLDRARDELEAIREPLEAAAIERFKERLLSMPAVEAVAQRHIERREAGEPPTCDSIEGDLITAISSASEGGDKP